MAVLLTKGKQLQLAPEKPSERLLTFTKLILCFHLAARAGSNRETLDKECKFMILL